MVFKIGQAEVHKRQKNIVLGLVFSVGLAVVMVLGDETFKASYNDLLIVSVVIFFVFANLINGIRHFQWKKTIQSHQIEVLDTAILFFKGDEKTVLKADQIRKMEIKRRKDVVTRILLHRVSGQKIRLEGYDGMDDFATAISSFLKSADACQVMTPPSDT